MTELRTEEGDEVQRILEGWTRQRPDLDPSPMGIFGRIARLAARSRADLTAWLLDYELTPAGFDVLANLRRHGPDFSKSPSELATSSMMSTGGMTFRIDKLEDAGLVVRTPSPDDRRAVVVTLTERGKSLIDQVIEIHLARQASLLERFDSSDRAAFATLLARLENEWVRAGRPDLG